MKRNFDDGNFCQLKEQEENKRLNNNSENNNFYESLEEMDQIENLPTEKIANPSSSINGSTGESDNKKDKNENLKSFNSIPQENEKKMTKALIAEKKETNIQNNVQSKEKKFNLNEAKEPVESPKMDIEDNMNIENESQGNHIEQNQGIDIGQNQIIGINQNLGNGGNNINISKPNQDEQINDIDVYILKKISVNKVEEEEHKKINSFDGIPIEDGNIHNTSLDLSKFCKVEKNNQH